MIPHNKIQELRKIQIREVELMGELRAFLKSHVAKLRKHQDGESVEVFDENGQSLGMGIIDNAFCGGAYLEAHEIKKYAQDPGKWEEEINTILYKVNVMKKDGTKGSYKLGVCTETPTKYGCYLVPKKALPLP